MLTGPAEPPLSPLRSVGKLVSIIASVFVFVSVFVFLMSCGIFRVYYNFYYYLVVSVMEPLGLLQSCRFTYSGWPFTIFDFYVSFHLGTPFGTA